MAFKLGYDDLFGSDIGIKWKQFTEKIVSDFAVAKKQVQQQAAEMLSQVSGMKTIDSKSIEQINKLKGELDGLKKKTTELSDAEKQYNQIIAATAREKAKSTEKNIAAAAALKKEKDAVRQLIKEKWVEKTSYIGINNELNKNIAKYKELDAVQRKSAGGKLLLNSIKQQTTELKKLDAQMGRFQRNVGNYKSAFKGIASGFLGATAVIYGAIRAIGGIIKINKDFQQSLSSLSAITGATGKDLQYYANQAKKASKETLQGANDIVKAYELVGSARPELLKNKEALAEVTKQSIILSEATGGKLGLVDSATALTGIMNQMEISAGDAGRTINVLAAGSKVGSANVVYLSTAFEKVGATANLMGLSLEETTGAIEAIAPYYSRAEVAGNSFDKVLLKLQANNIGYKSGVFKLNDAIDELREKYKNGTSAADIFGVEHAKMGVLLVKNKDKFNEYSKAVTGSNVALEQQAIQNDNLANNWKRLINIVQNAFISTGTGGGLLNNIVKGLINATQGLTLFKNKFIEAFNELIRGSGIFRAAIATVSQAIVVNFKGIINTVMLVIEPFLLLGRVIKDALTGNWDEIKGEIGTSFEHIKNRAKNLGNAFKDAGITIKDAFTGNNIDKYLIKVEEAEDITSLFADTITESDDKIIKSNKEVAKTFSEIADQTKNLSKEIDDLYSLSEKGTDDLNDEFFESLKKQLSSISDEFNKQNQDELRIREETGHLKKQLYEEELEVLKKVYEKGAITEKEYNQQRLHMWISYNEEIIDAAKQLQGSLTDLAVELNNVQLQQLEQEISVHDQAIDALRDRVDKEKELYDQGAANNYLALKRQLDSELIARNRAQEEFKRIKKREAQIQLASQAANLITSSTNIFAESTKQSGPYGVIIAAAAIASMIALFLSYKAKINALNAEVPAYAEGTEYVRGKGTETSDSIDAKLSKGERVVPAYINKQLDGITNKELLDIYKMNNIKLYNPEDYKSDPYDIYAEGTQAMKDLLYYHKNEEEKFIGTNEYGEHIFKRGNDVIIRKWTGRVK